MLTRGADNLLGFVPWSFQAES